MSEIKRYLENKDIWNKLKALLKSCYKETPDEKMVDEKEVYKSILLIMETMEKEVVDNE